MQNFHEGKTHVSYQVGTSISIYSWLSSESDSNRPLFHTKTNLYSNIYQEPMHNSDKIIPTNKKSFTAFPLFHSPNTSPSCGTLQYKVPFLCEWQFPYQPCLPKNTYKELRWKGWGWTWQQLHPVLRTIVGLQPPHMEVLTREHYMRSIAPPVNSQCQARCLHNAQRELDMEERESQLSEGTPYNRQ